MPITAFPFLYKEKSVNVEKQNSSLKVQE